MTTLASSMCAPQVIAADRRPSWLRVDALSSPPVEADAVRRAVEEAQSTKWTTEGVGYVDSLFQSNVVVRRSGRIESTTTLVRLFLTESGVQQGGNLSAFADASRDEITIDAAYTVTPGSPPTGVAPETLQAVRYAQPDIFSDWHEVVVPFTELYRPEA